VSEDGLLGRTERWARAIKRDVVALWLAARDPRVPWNAKAVAAAVAAYALSPIDLIPDFIPVLGYLDDLIIVPLGILLAIKLVPPALMAEFRAEASARSGRPVSRVGAALIIALWIAAALLLLWVFWPAPARGKARLGPAANGGFSDVGGGGSCGALRTRRSLRAKSACPGARDPSKADR
jgi:uncharacterized membrane protein YkvA (DUF1232 family)